MPEATSTIASSVDLPTQLLGQISEVSSTVKSLLEEQRVLWTHITQLMVGTAPAPPSEPSGSTNPSTPANNIAVPITPATSVYVTQSPTLPSFDASVAKHPVKFLEEINRYFRKMAIPEEQKIQIVSESMKEKA